MEMPADDHLELIVNFLFFIVIRIQDMFGENMDTESLKNLVIFLNYVTSINNIYKNIYYVKKCSENYSPVFVLDYWEMCAADFQCCTSSIIFFTLKVWETLKSLRS